MIYQNTEIENTRNKFSNAIKELQLGKLLRKANITKNCGVPAYEVPQFLLLLVLQGKNLFRFLNSKHKDQDSPDIFFWSGYAVTKMTKTHMANYFSCSVTIYKTWI